MKERIVYDVIILGGGLAGLTLACQLKQTKPALSILVMEKRLDKAPVAAHKVGESIVEIGAFYLREVLHLKEYLNKHQLLKLGFRFFLSPEHRNQIARRVEVGSKIPNPIPTHQIDRGLLENMLVDKLDTIGVEIALGMIVNEVELSKAGHTVHCEKAGINCDFEGRWVIDSTGRRGLLKRQLRLEKESDHNVNAVWFRLGCEIDIDDWSEDEDWRAYLEPGRRRLATNHLMGEGYWVWIIPLVSGNTSIGIVADPSFHSLNAFNSFEKAMKWLGTHEPVAANMLGNHKKRLIDFKVMKHFAHDTKNFYSADRWGITGDAGAFLDPFYSPGTDFIALNNSWLTELIIRDSGGEDISLRAMIYEHAHKESFRSWMSLYRNMYGLFGKTQIMLMKIVWDWAAYWAIPALMFRNNGYTNIDVLKIYATSAHNIGPRFSKLNEQMQTLFFAWGQHEVEPCSDRRINVFDLDCLSRFYYGLEEKHESEKLMDQVGTNLKILELIAAEIFRRASAHIHGTPSDMMVDPYNMALDEKTDALLEKSKAHQAFAVDESIKADINRVWLNRVKTLQNEYAQ